MNFAILGTGRIASIMAETIQKLAHPEITLYAVASRTQEKADNFAQKYNIPTAYASYEELVQDPHVDLIYIATPHSHHFENAKLCLEHKKKCVMRKTIYSK